MTSPLYLHSRTIPPVLQLTTVVSAGHSGPGSVSTLLTGDNTTTIQNIARSTVLVIATLRRNSTINIQSLCKEALKLLACNI